MYQVFNTHAQQYEKWFDTHTHAYRSELMAVQTLLPQHLTGMEIGLGTARFCSPLGITHGVEPSTAMRRVARSRGINVVAGVGENLPYKNERFGFALMVTTICFVDNALKCCRETFRVLHRNGAFVVGFVDRESFLGRQYQEKKHGHIFYRDAHFFSIDDVQKLMCKAGFVDFEYRQTLFERPSRLNEPHECAQGYGSGAFVVLRGWKRTSRPRA